MKSMSSTGAVTPAPDRVRPRRRSRTLKSTIMLAGLAFLLAGCTVAESSTFVADVTPWSQYITIQRRPTWQVVTVHQSVCHGDPGCTMRIIIKVSELHVPWYLQAVWNKASGDSVGFGRAIDASVNAGNEDGQGMRQCLAIFSVWSIGWTTNVGASCQPGELVRPPSA